MLVCLALGTGGIHHSALAVGQAVVLGQTHCNVDPCTQVSGQDQVGADLVEALGLDHGQGVLLCLDGALLQRGEDLRQCHGGGLCAQSLESGNGHSGLRGTDNQVVAIGNAGQLLGGGDVTGTAGEVAQALHAAGLHQALELLADFAGQHLLHLLIALDQVGHADHAKVRLVGLHGLAGEGDIHRAAVGQDALDHIDLRSQLAVGEDIDFDSAVGVCFAVLLELQSALVPGVALVIDVADVDDDLIAGHFAACCCAGTGGGSSRAGGGAAAAGSQTHGQSRDTGGLHEVTTGDLVDTHRNSLLFVGFIMPALKAERCCAGSCSRAPRAVCDMFPWRYTNISDYRKQDETAFLI